jgi:hypothetical protein
VYPIHKGMKNALILITFLLAPLFIGGIMMAIVLYADSQQAPMLTPLENTNPSTDSAPSPTITTTPYPDCGNGICSRIERTQGICAADC